MSGLTSQELPLGLFHVVGLLSNAQQESGLANV